MQPCHPSGGALAMSLCLAACVLLLLLPAASRQDAEQFEQYEPANELCEKRCECRRTNASLALDCTGRGMTHVLAAWPPHPARLVASFSRNNISTLQQVPASDAASIALSFRQCGVRALSTQLFIDASGIEFLDLSWNALTAREFDANVFRGRYTDTAYEAIGLRQLVLAHNALESLPHSVFEHTPNLTHLDLSHNPIRLLDPQLSHAISSLLRLAVLNLRNTSIAELPEASVSRLRWLRELDLSGNRFTAVPETLGFLSGSLELLRLDNNPIVHLDDSAFMGLERLRQLNVSAMSQLRSIRHNTFSQLHQLRAVHCAHNKKLQHLHPEAFGVEDNRPAVQELYLGHNDLVTLAQHLLNWSEVTVLELAGNRWHCDCPLYYTMLEVRSANAELESMAATCAQPAAATGLPLFDLAALNTSCVRLIGGGPPLVSNRANEGQGLRSFVRIALAVVCVCLTLASAVVFYKIVLKYRNVRAVHSAYPVMYISAPTVEH